MTDSSSDPAYLPPESISQSTSQQQQRIKILSVAIDPTSYTQATAQILEWANNGGNNGGNYYVVIANVHVIMTAASDRHYDEILAAADLVTPDGMPLVWGMRQLGAPQQTRVYGPDLMLACCAALAKQRIPIFLYGATPDTLKQLEINLYQRFPNLEIAGSYAPPFFTGDYDSIQKQVAMDLPRILATTAKVIFIGLGCPKQEQWMAAALAQSRSNQNNHRTNHQNHVGVMIGVGAAFDFHSGQVKQAPRWMMRLGLEWFYRLCQEPQRLWRRYLLNNPLFVIRFGGQLLWHYWRKRH